MPNEVEQLQGLQEPVEEVKKPFGKEEIQKAIQTLRDYKSGKANLDRRIVENEQWWKLRHWEQLRPAHGAASDPMPTSGWLLNVLLSKHADAMDSQPEPIVLPREPGDREQAKTLQAILPVIMEHNDYSEVYSDCWWYKIKHGASCKMITWEPSKLNGLGDVAIQRVDLLNLFWEPGVTDIQKSRNLFHVKLYDIDELEEMYPQLKGELKTGNGSVTVESYIYDDNVDVSKKAAVIDMYYKRRDAAGRTKLHYAKFCNEHLLYSSENEEMESWYQHNLFPFILDVLFPEEGTPAGFGLIDVCKSPQEQIDILNNAFLKNAIAGSTPRWFIRNDGAINEEEYMDWRKPFVHTTASLGQDSILQINAASLDSIYVSLLNNKIEELKETSGNRDVTNGGTQSGATAASAIAAMQEQAGKLSRDQISTSYIAYRKECLMIIELIRQFYDMPRMFRITGEAGQQEFVTYDNSQLGRQPIIGPDGSQMGIREPVFDITVMAQKANAYSKMSQNELAIQLYNMGTWNPEAATQILPMLNMMDFKGKEEVVQEVQRNGDIAAQPAQTQQQLMAAMQQLDPTGAMSQRYAEETGAGMQQPKQGNVNPEQLTEQQKRMEDGLNTGEHHMVQKARENTRESTQPR